MPRPPCSTEGCDNRHNLFQRNNVYILQEVCTCVSVQTELFTYLPFPHGFIDESRTIQSTHSTKFLDSQTYTNSISSATSAEIRKHTQSHRITFGVSSVLVESLREFYKLSRNLDDTLVSNDLCPKKLHGIFCSANMLTSATKVR